MSSTVYKTVSILNLERWRNKFSEKRKSSAITTVNMFAGKVILDLQNRFALYSRTIRGSDSSFISYPKYV